MKLISLNTWGCRTGAKIYDFIRSQTETVDIFCFQELTRSGVGLTDKGDPKDSYDQVATILSEYDGHFTSYGELGYYGQGVSGLDFEPGIATFVKKKYSHKFVEGGSLYNPTKKWGDYKGSFAAGAVLAVEAQDYFIVNVHGQWQESIKSDTEAKLEQSEDIIKLVNKSAKKPIICGDFNLLPDTRSIQMLRGKYHDLIQEYDIQDTRGVLYTKDLRYSDFIFTDKDIKIKDFSVPSLEISDHLPLILEFD